MRNECEDLNLNLRRMLISAVCLFSMGATVRGEAQALLDTAELDSTNLRNDHECLLTCPGTVWKLGNVLDGHTGGDVG